MSKAIHQKREQFRNILRQKQRETFFMNQRKRMLQSLQTKNIDPISMLKKRINLTEAFEQINRRINGANYFNQTKAMVDEGLLFILINFLKQGICLKQVLQVFCYSFEREILAITCNQLFSHGFLQYLLLYLKNHQTSLFASHLLYKFTQIDQSYSEIIMFNHSYRHMIEVLKQRLRQDFNQEQQNKSSHNFFRYILLSFQNMIQTKQSTLDLSQQKHEIYQFVLQLIKNRIFLKINLGIVYETVNRLGKQAIYRFIPLVKNLLLEAHRDNPYLYNLYACIYVCLPFQFDEHQIFKLGVMVPKLQYPLILIIDKMINQSNFYLRIPQDQVWWGKLLDSPLDDQLYIRMLKLIANLNIKQEWVWRTLSDSLENDSIKIQLEAVCMLNLKITDKQSFNVANILDKFRIRTKLQRLIHSKNENIRNRVNLLLDYILGPLIERQQMPI